MRSSLSLYVPLKPLAWQMFSKYIPPATNTHECVELRDWVIPARCMTYQFLNMQ
jgi:hypothetical protein